MLSAVGGPTGVSLITNLTTPFPGFARHLAEFLFTEHSTGKEPGSLKQGLATVAALGALEHRPIQLRVRVPTVLDVGCIHHSSDRSSAF